VRSFLHLVFYIAQLQSDSCLIKESFDLICNLGFVQSTENPGE